MCRETSILLQGGRGEAFHSSTAFNYATKYVTNFLARIVFGIFLNTLLVVVKTKKVRVREGERANKINFLKSVYCNI